MELDANGITTIRQAISTVREALRSINIDDRVSNRYIYSLLSGYANTFIKQDNDQRRLFQESNLFKTIECFEMEESSMNDSCDILITNCNKVMKSKQKLPKFYTTIYGNVLSVYSIFGDIKYDYISPSDYQDYLNREFKSKRSGVYWIHNDYLVIPNSFADIVMLRGMFTNQNEIDKLNGVTSSTTGTGLGSCLGIMDQPFVVPTYIIGNILKYTIADIRNITVPLQEDAIPNNNQAERSLK